MPLRVKYFAAFSLITLLVACLAAYGILTLTETDALIIRLYDGPVTIANHARAASITLHEARIEMRRGMTDLVEARDAVASLRRMQTTIGTDLGIVRQQTHDPVLRVAVDRAAASITRWF